MNMNKQKLAEKLLRQAIEENEDCGITEKDGVFYEEPPAEKVEMNKKDAILIICSIWEQLYRIDAYDEAADRDKDITNERLLNLADKLGILNEVNKEYNKL